MNRDEHLEWAKQRALEYLDNGQVADAITSMLSDLSKHEELHGVGEKLAMLWMMSAMQNDSHGARRFIEGFR